MKRAKNLTELQAIRESGRRLDFDNIPSFGEYTGNIKGILSWDTRNEDKAKHEFLVRDGEYGWNILSGKIARATGY